jgi:hypothetical protein
MLGWEVIEDQERVAIFAPRLCAARVLHLGTRPPSISSVRQPHPVYTQHQKYRRTAANVAHACRAREERNCDAVEGVVGHEEDLVYADTCDCGGLGIRGHVRLEGVCFRDPDHLVERNTVIYAQFALILYRGATAPGTITPEDDLSRLCLRYSPLCAHDGCSAQSGGRVCAIFADD